MGYSIAVQFPDNETKARMLAFLAKEYRPIDQLLPDIYEKGRASLHGPSDSLSYERARNIVGFDYTLTDDMEWAYALNLLGWMALKAGVRRDGRPEIRYDGCEVWPVEVGAERSKDGYACDELGFRSLSRGKDSVLLKLLEALARGPTKRIDDTLRAELLRLDASWATFVA